MHFPHDGDVTIVVIEMEPGLVFVKLADPKPEPERAELFLRRTIEDWLRTHPDVVIDRTQPVFEKGEIQGIEVCYHINSRQPATTFVMQMNQQNFQHMTSEYIEAVVEEALEIWRSHEGTIVVVNPRRFAVILDRLANRGAVFVLDRIYSALDETAQKQIHTYLEAPATRFCVVDLPGSWFLPPTVASRLPRLAEPSSICTNMTYDTGPRPKKTDDGIKP